MALFATSELGFIIEGLLLLNKGCMPPGFGIGQSPESGGRIIVEKEQGGQPIRVLAFRAGLVRAKVE
jgi:hypothetical protein